MGSGSFFSLYYQAIVDRKRHFRLRLLIMNKIYNKYGSFLNLRAFSKGLSLLLLAWCLIPSTPVQARSKKVYKQKTYINFEETLVEGTSRSPYSSYLFKKKESLVNDLSQWKPDWRNRIWKSRTKLK